ncbi:hypothetical protein [Pinibacter aurantiacus]|uniref:Transmembrane protein n=1 Tax=Pinibacter aurantiacus TaxID=2851599 RepID=A0A9E2W8D5_9BACT|nr:hypothetical protein [Pinibacter aurantiacus]MBV4358366.1 hypothetical protein [Pinibacter aurantiacus]
MAEKSFYDLDYIIEINEKRVEQYMSAYQKVLERLTNIILIYSALTFFLFTIIQEVFLEDGCHWLMKACFILFALLLGLSLFFTVKLIIPVDVGYLENPKPYYEEYRLRYEEDYPKNHSGSELMRISTISKLLKASYIEDLQNVLEANIKVYRRKSSFYYKALMLALLSTIPYLICLGFHISKKDDKIQKVQIMNSIISRTLPQIDSMGKQIPPGNNQSTNTTKSTDSSYKIGITTKLPGIDPSKVISPPTILIREDRDRPSKKR